MPRDELVLGKLDAKHFLQHQHNFDRHLFDVRKSVPCVRVSAALVQTVMRVCSAVLLNLPRYASVQRVDSEKAEDTPRKDAPQQAQQQQEQQHHHHQQQPLKDSPAGEVSADRVATATAATATPPSKKAKQEPSSSSASKASKERFVLFSPTKTDEEIARALAPVFPDKPMPKIGRFTVCADYSYWTAEQVLKAALPESFDEVTTSFETVGHLAHMNLREHQLPYKHFIGQVILDKNARLRTVVNKLNAIDTTFRFFKMELLAGEEDFQCRVKENGCWFEFDFSTVYWNSRLQKEHERVVDKTKRGDVLLDMMAGVGPFALPAAKRGCTAYANDLNPASYRALVHNIALNKLSARVTPFNMDARAFVRHIIARVLATPEGDKQWPAPTHVTMNLPASSIEFTDAFRGAYAADTKRRLPLPTIHCHCFSSAEDKRADVISRIEERLGHPLQEPIEFRDVRDVGPNKRMVCISFRLPAAAAYDTTAEATQQQQQNQQQAEEQHKDEADK